MQVFTGKRTAVAALLRAAALSALIAATGAGCREGALGERGDPATGPERAAELAEGLRKSFPGAPGEAEQMARDALAKDPGDLSAHARLVGALAHQRRFDAAIEQAERWRGLDPQNVRPILRLSELEERRGNRARASALLAEARRLAPDSVAARVREAVLLRGEGMAAEADEILRGLLRTAPDDPWLNIVYAREVELVAGDTKAAEARVSRVVERAPFAADAWRLLGELRDRGGRPGEGAAAYRDGLVHDPDDANLHAKLGLVLLRLGETDAAEPHLRDGIRLGADDPVSLHSGIGVVLSGRGLLAEASAAYDRAIALEPKNLVARNNRALVWLDAGRVADAKREFTAIAAEFPGYAGARNNLASVALQEGDWRTVEMQARQALRIDEKHVPAWNNLGVALDRQGRSGDAEAAYRKALAYDAGYWQARLNLAILESKQGRTDAALAGLAEVLRQAPGQPEAQLELADIHGARGDSAKAREYFEAYLRTAKPGPVTEAARKRLAALGKDTVTR